MTGEKGSSAWAGAEVAGAAEAFIGFIPQGLEQPPKGTALKKEGRRLRNRELPGSLPELVTNPLPV